MHTSIQAHQPAIAAHANTGNCDLIRVELQEKGADASITLRREVWQQLVRELDDAGLYGPERQAIRELVEARAGR